MTELIIAEHYQLLLLYSGSAYKGDRDGAYRSYAQGHRRNFLRMCVLTNALLLCIPIFLWWIIFNNNADVSHHMFYSVLSL